MIEMSNFTFPSPEQWSAVIRGMRNPMNSWEKSDSYSTHVEDIDTLETAEYQYFIGEHDLELMKSLSKAGTDHSKYLRMLPVIVDITAPTYWWLQFDTFKVGTVSNSCSKMHKLAERDLTTDDFSTEYMNNTSLQTLELLLTLINAHRANYLRYKDKDFWYQMIQLLPESYNQRRTVFLNYEVLKHMYHSRKDHKLAEWRTFCKEIEEKVPYFKELCVDE